MSELPRPRIEPYRRHDRPGKWRCFHSAPGGHVYEGTGYSPGAAYEKWLNALTCKKRKGKR